MAGHSTFIDVLKIASHSNIVNRAITTAVIVGTILTVINQWEIINTPELLDFMKIALTYTTPFCVSVVSATLSKLDHIKAQTIKDLEMEGSKQR